MDLSKLSTEELRLKLACTTEEIDMLGRQIKRFQANQQEACDIELEYQTEIDRREIEIISDADFIEQLEYFLHNYSIKRSNAHLRCCDKFFDMLSLTINVREKTARFKAHPDFIKTNYEVILQYLPRVFEFCRERIQMETNKFHMITVENNKMVDRINYYPDTKNYFTDGVYIRSHKTLESVLDHMMEVA